MANQENLGSVQFVRGKLLEITAWRKRGIADLLDSLPAMDILVVSELSRLGRSILECREIFFVAAQKDVNGYAVNDAWRLDQSMQSSTWDFSSLCWDLPFYVGTLKGVGRIYQQTFIDTYSKVAFAKLYDRKTSLTAADLLNDQVIPFFETHEVPLSRILTDRGTEYCGSPDSHEYELYLAVENIDHTRTKVKSPQTNGIVERLHRTMLTEFYRITFRKKIYTTLVELQKDLDEWLRYYNEERIHQGRWCYGRTPMQTFFDTIPLAKEKVLAA